MMEWYLILDCWPGHPRPGDIYEEINIDIRKAGFDPLPKASDETTHRFMGEWKWEFDTTQEYYDKVVGGVIHTLQGLYDPKSMAAFLSTGQPQAGIRYYSIGRE